MKKNIRTNVPLSCCSLARQYAKHSRWYLQTLSVACQPCVSWIDAHVTVFCGTQWESNTDFWQQSNSRYHCYSLSLLTCSYTIPITPLPRRLYFSLFVGFCQQYCLDSYGKNCEKFLDFCAFCDRRPALNECSLVIVVIRKSVTNTQLRHVRCCWHRFGRSLLVKPVRWFRLVISSFTHYCTIQSDIYSDVCQFQFLQCFDTVGWAAGRASGL